MKVLLGTTNPSKVKRFSNLLEGCDIEFITLKDIEITDEPKEDGATPEENAICRNLHQKINQYNQTLKFWRALRRFFTLFN